MLKVTILAAGKMRKGPLQDLVNEYTKRIQWNLTIHEIESKQTAAAAVQQDEAEKMLEKLDPNAFTIVLDERGNGLKSIDFAQTIEKLSAQGENHFQFIIGGADGLTDEVRGQANLLLSFGQQTWPHMLARVMLLEQVYRAQQINAGHPYHRE